MNKRNPTIWLILLIAFTTTQSYAQKSERVIIHTDNCNDLIAGIYNYVSIIATQDSLISEDQISAFLITPYNYYKDSKPKQLEVVKEYGRFKIIPDSVGVVEFHIVVNGETEIETVRVKPLEAVCRLSRYKANSEKKIPLAEFKAQLGLIAYVECCGFNARCKVQHFEVIRIPSDEIASRKMNKGARFEDSVQSLINEAKSGDIYIFRNIYYRCPATEEQRSEDMIFEIE